MIIFSVGNKASFFGLSFAVILGIVFFPLQWEQKGVAAKMFAEKRTKVNKKRFFFKFA